MAPIIPNSSAETDFLRLQKLVDFYSSSQEVIAVTVPLPRTEPLFKRFKPLTLGGLRSKYETKVVCSACNH
jgi:hypothetical protein